MNFARLLLPLFLLVLAGCAGTYNTNRNAANQENVAVNSSGRHIAKDTSRTIDLTDPPADAWDRIRRGFAIPNLDTDLAQQWTDYYTAHPESVQRMTTRASKYLFFIVDEVNRRGLPTELALLPFIESAYNPSALSSSKASGLWQFIPSTGQHFNLKQDWWRDERRDPIASTYAALDYLEKLFEMQGDWYLALASYNWGEGSVQRAVAKNDAAGLATDYMSLNMPEETRNYVPKLQAIKNIIADPEKYAMLLPPVSNTPYFATVQKNDNIDLAIAAQLAEMPLEEFKALNPSYNRPVILGQHAPTLLVPTDRLATFNNNLTNFKGDLSSWTVYNVRSGESYAAIAKRFGIAESTLRQANDISAKRKSAAAGQSLLVPGKGAVQLASLTPPAGAIKTVAASSNKKAVAKTPASTVASAKTGNTVRSHKIRSGDTLFSLAKQYGTTVDNLRSLNNLKNTHLKVGSQLRIPGGTARG